MDPRQIPIRDYDYPLPQERIASFPLDDRDASRLLIYRRGIISEDVYRNISDHLPANSLLLFNNTKVVEARLLFTKPSGGTIELFCLEPAAEQADIATGMQQKGSVLWNCLIGGASKWKKGQVLVKQKEQLLLEARFAGREADCFRISFQWTPAALSFAEVLHRLGQVPLPPYLHRQPEISDAQRYQTIFAQPEGSVAAPTAGLHFTPQIFARLRTKKIRHEFLTLHVGAGTFRPVKSDRLGGHEMHAEYFELQRETLASLRTSLGSPIVAVGTTSLRVLETIYWTGVKLLMKREPEVLQWDPYELPGAITPEEALAALEKYLDERSIGRFIAKTRLLIAPAYRFRVADGLITNFHQPQSTLLLLVAAFIGEDWRKLYQYALEHEFRFLSYGDGCLLWRS